MKVAFLACIVVFSLSQRPLNDIINEKELFVSRICDSVRTYYSESELSTNCDRYWSCDDLLHTKITLNCEPNFGKSNDCDCSTNTSSVSINTPTLRYAPGTDPNSIPISQFACFTESIKMTYLQNYIEANSNSASQVWQYIGSPTGTYSIWPGNSQLWDQPSPSNQCKTIQHTTSTCPSYDPRIRPWYIAAASSPKDAILILDKSGSMGQHGRMDLLKDAAKTVIDGFGVYDNIGVIGFSSAATSCMGNTLVSGIDDNKKSLKNCIDNFADNGGTNFQAAFQLAFNIINYRIASNCHTVMLFLTDGIITEGLEGSNFLNWIEEQNTNDIRAKIFTFSLGTGADIIIPKALACANKGVWMPIEDQSDDLRSLMSGYYNYFIYSNHTRGVTWSENYFDYSGLGWMTTAAQGCFSESKKFFGVAGVDVLISEFENEGHTWSNNVENILYSRSNHCYDLEMDEIMLDDLRTFHKCTFQMTPEVIMNIIINIILYGSLLGFFLLLVCGLLIFFVGYLVYYCICSAY